MSLAFGESELLRHKCKRLRVNATAPEAARPIEWPAVAVTDGVAELPATGSATALEAEAAREEASLRSEVTSTLGEREVARRPELLALLLSQPPALSLAHFLPHSGVRR